MARVKKHGRGWQTLYRNAQGRERSAGTYQFRRDAMKRKAQVEHEREIGEFVDPALRTTPFAEWSATWFDSRAGLKPKTLESYASLLRSRILPRFEEARLRDIQPIDVQRFISDMEAEGLSASRIRQAHQTLSAILKAAVLNRMLPFNPADGASLPKATHREMLFLEPPDIDRLASAIDADYRTWVYTQAYVGLRWGEASALRRSRINLLRSRIEVAESASDVSGKVIFGDTKSRKRRTIALPAFLNEKLTTHLAERVESSPDALVFTAKRGGVLRHSVFTKYAWRPALKEAGLPSALRIHDLRHTCAALLIAQGAHPEAIKRHLGHSSIAITMDRYGHLMRDEAGRIADGLDAIYRSKKADRLATL